MTDVDVTLGPIAITDANGDIIVTAAGLAARVTVGSPTGPPGITVNLGAVVLTVNELALEINTTRAVRTVGTADAAGRPVRPSSPPMEHHWTSVVRPSPPTWRSSSAPARAAGR